MKAQNKPTKSHKTIFSRLGSRFLFSFALGILATLLPISARAAERISFIYAPFGEFYIYVDDLEIWAKEGRITPRLAFFTNRIEPEQVEMLQDLLSRNIGLNPLAIYRFSHSPIGETVFRNMGEALKADFNLNGFYALRAAVNQAAFHEDGLTIVNTLRQFPLDTIILDTDVALKWVEEASELLRDKEFIVAAIKQQAEAEKNQTTSTTSNYQEDLRTSGKLRWSKETLMFQNPNREAPSAFDLYLPDYEVKKPAPLIVISHGLGSNRNTFAYLGEHLASHGFAVAIPEHIGTNSDKFSKFLSGLARPPKPSNLINRPLDVTFLLDKLEQESLSNPNLQGRLNVQKVGVIGQSLGGYTVLTLGGAQLNRENVEEECVGERNNNVFFNLSVLIQCRLSDLPLSNYSLRDERVQAVLALNPLSNGIFGKQGISRIQVPTMIVAGVNDFVTPPVPEQIYPFAWLQNPNKYLMLVEEGTHFTFLEEEVGIFPIPEQLVGPDPSLAFSSLKALSTAFFKTYITERSEYNIYLSPSYIESINTNPFKFYLIQSLTEIQLEKALD